MTDKVKVTLWLPGKIKEKLRKSAKAQYRTMSNLNEVVLTDYLKTEHKNATKRR